MAKRVRSTPILFEHGAGQSYGNRHASYVGGKGRETVKLFVVPNEQAAARNRRYYPTTPNVIVGSPRLDELAGIGRAVSADGRPTVAISFHWRSPVAPEAGTALDHYAAALPELRARLEADGIRLIGHGHPRAWPELEPIYTRAGIEPVRWCPEVVARADLYAVDNSSTLFEFAGLGRPVVVLNSPTYRRDVNFGLRFWSEADVGLQVNEPDELFATLLLALVDPPEVAEIRAGIVDRLYPVRDGSSARLAADAVARLVICPICHAPHASCGGTETPPVGIVDLPQESSNMAGPLKRYSNPVKKGAFIRLSDAEAKRLGILGQHLADRERTAPPLDLASSAPAETMLVRSSAIPKGAMPPGGPTQRARAKAGAGPATTPPEEPVTTPTPTPAPDAPKTKPEPDDKKRPAPTSSGARRRRRPVTS
jgi:hypothetical protein